MGWESLGPTAGGEVSPRPEDGSGNQEEARPHWLRPPRSISTLDWVTPIAHCSGRLRELRPNWLQPPQSIYWHCIECPLGSLRLLSIPHSFVQNILHCHFPLAILWFVLCTYTYESLPLWIIYWDCNLILLLSELLNLLWNTEGKWERNKRVKTQSPRIPSIWLQKENSWKTQEGYSSWY